MLKAWFMCAVIVIGLHTLAMFMLDNSLFPLIFFSSLSIAACFLAYYAPRQKFWWGMSMVLVALVSFIGTAIIYNFIGLSTTGESIFPELSDLISVPWLIFILNILAASSIFCALGSKIGIFISKKMKPK